jgi:soluble lytic murein transglycosylase-like protein
MKRPYLALTLFVAVSDLTAPNLTAQARPLPAEASDIARLRTDKAVARQRNALTAMAESIASQQSSVARQRKNQRSDGFFDSQPVRTLNPLSIATPCSSLPPGEIDTLVDLAAGRTSVSPELIRSVMRQESAYRPCAVSAKGAVGLMQLLPTTASDLGVTNPLDPEENILGGATLLKQLMDRYGGDLKLTLSAYNAGPGKVDAAMGVPLIPETIDYVTRILSHLSPPSSVQPANTERDNQSGRDSAAAIKLRLTGTDDGE